MPRNPRRLLILSRERWSLHDAATRKPPLAEGEGDAQQAGQLVAQLREQLGGELQADVVVALEADLCLAARLESLTPRQLRKPAALAFQLEETLPIAAEEVVAAFVTRRNAALGVACERKWLANLMTDLTSAGASVVGVAPAALLAAEEGVRRGLVPGASLLILVHDQRADVIELAEGRAAEWTSTTADRAALTRWLAARQLSEAAQPPACVLGAPGMDLAETGVTAAGLDGETADYPSLVAAAGLRVLNGDAAAPANLLVQELADLTSARKPLRWEQLGLKGAVALLLVAVLAFGARRALLLGSAADAAASAQEDLFRELYPDQRVPVGVGARLESDLRRLRGVRGEGGGLPTTAPAMTVVEKLLGALPAEMRLRILEVRFENDELLVTGQVRSHSDADRVAAAMRRAGFRVTPPSTQQLPEQGVDFRLSATLDERAREGS